MALFMDSHAIDGGVKASDVAEAHLADLQTQDRYGVRYLRYWVDEFSGQDLLPGRCTRCRGGNPRPSRSPWPGRRLDPPGR